MSELDKRRQHARDEGWPPGSRQMGIDDMDRMGIMEDTGEMLWDGKKIITEQRITLRLGELWLAIVVAASAFVTAVFPILVHFGII